MSRLLTHYLKVLSLKYCTIKLSSLNAMLTGLQSLTVLDLSESNGLKKLNLECPQLLKINVSETKIEKIKIAAPNLIYLRASY